MGWDRKWYLLVEHQSMVAFPPPSPCIPDLFVQRVGPAAQGQRALQPDRLPLLVPALHRVRRVPAPGAVGVGRRRPHAGQHEEERALGDHLQGRRLPGGPGKLQGVLQVDPSTLLRLAGGEEESRKILTWQLKNFFFS